MVLFVQCAFNTKCNFSVMSFALCGIHFYRTSKWSLQVRRGMKLTPKPGGINTWPNWAQLIPPSLRPLPRPTWWHILVIPSSMREAKWYTWSQGDFLKYNGHNTHYIQSTQRVRHRTLTTSLHAVSGSYYLEVCSQVTYYLLYRVWFRVIQELFSKDLLGFCCGNCSPNWIENICFMF